MDQLSFFHNGNGLLIHREQLQVGCILEEDVFAKTSQPIMRKDTVINERHIEVLEAFLIQQVRVKDVLINGEKFQPEEIIKEQEEDKKKSLPFLEQYLQSVQLFKKEFKKWVHGEKVKMEQIRSLLHPLLEQPREVLNQSLFLHHYSTKEDYVYHHSVAIALLSFFLAQKQGYSQKESLQIGLSAVLCDIGMSKLPPRILQNKGILTEEEFEEVKSHPYYSYRMIQESFPVANEVMQAVLQHHEREDGSGYPLSIKREKIHPYSRIVAVADVYHAMTSERYHRRKKSPYKVIDDIHRNHFGKLDPTVVKTLMDSLLTYSIGTKVRLSDGNVAEIVYIDEKNLTQPFVRKFDEKDVIQLSGETYIETILPT